LFYNLPNVIIDLKGGVAYMRMIPVDSSNLSSVGYENGTLYISFNNGGTYYYTGVPEFVFEDLLNAPSKGKYFHANIKNSYPYGRL
jgi:hypothetical protein